MVLAGAAPHISIRVSMLLKPPGGSPWVPSRIKVHFIHILLFLLTFNRLIHFDPLKNWFFIPHFHDPNLPKSKMVIWPMTKMLNPEDLGWIHDYQMIPYRWIQDLLIFVFLLLHPMEKPHGFCHPAIKIRTESTPRCETELPAWILGVCDFGCHSGLCFSDISDLVKVSTRKSREIPMFFCSIGWWCS